MRLRIAQISTEPSCPKLPLSLTRIFTFTKCTTRAAIPEAIVVETLDLDMRFLVLALRKTGYDNSTSSPRVLKLLLLRSGGGLNADRLP